MKLNKQNTDKIAFKGSFYNNKLLLKSLHFAGEKGALAAAGTTLVCASLIRPTAIMMTPNTCIEDKQYACAKSIESGLLNAGLTAAIFTPMTKVIDRISKKPNNYLKPETLKTLQQNSKTLDEAPAYNFIKQIVKMSPELLAALPKALITVALIVPVTNFIFNRNKKDKTPQKENISSSKTSFKGLDSEISNKIIGMIENKKIQQFSLKHKDSNFIQHALNLKDIYATTCFAAITALNPKIKKERKESLIYNTAISTLLTIGGSYAVDKGIEKPVKKFTENFAIANKNDPNLYKYLNGIKVLKPIIILSSLYYIGIPMLSTFFAGKLAKNTDGNKVAK